MASLREIEIFRKIRDGKIWECSICHGVYEGWSNNAWPVTDGVCCKDCNDLYVIPARIERLAKEKA